MPGKSRPSARLSGKLFIETAQDLSYEKIAAEHAWRRIMDAQAGGKHTVTSARERSMTMQQFVDTVSKGPDEFRGITYERWSLIVDVAEKLVDGLKLKL